MVSTGKNERFLTPWVSGTEIFQGKQTKVLTNINMQVLSERLPRCYKYVYDKIFFSRTTGLWDFLPVECFPLTIDLNGCKSRVNIHLLSLETF